MLVEQARFLVDNPEAVETATLALERGAPPLTLRAQLEREYAPEYCRALLDCAQARLRFADKLKDGRHWLLTGTAAEQASSWPMARWRAERLKTARPNASVLELGCGIGGDTVFLTQVSTVTAFEQCPARTLLCRYNVEKFGRSEHLTLENSEAELEALEGEILYCDPSRRSHKRISSPQDWEPPLSRVLSLLESKRFPLVAVKCAPGLDLTQLSLSDFPLEISFLSVNGDLKECFILAGTESGKKQAVLLSSQSDSVINFCSNKREIPPANPEPGLYLHNPDPAVLRAEALDTLAEQLKAGQPHPKIGYLIGSSPCPDTAAQSFLIEDSFPLRWADLKKRVARSGWSEFEYLGRGVPFGQAEVRAELPRLKRGKSAPKRGSIIIYREHDGYRAVLATRVRRETEQRHQSLPS